MRDLNFFSNYIKARESLKNKTLVSFIAFVVLMIIIGSTYAIIEMAAGAINKDTESIRVYLNSSDIKDKMRDIQDMRKKLEILNRYDTAIDAILSDIRRVNVIKSTLIENINKTLPGETKINSINFTPVMVTIQGSAPGRVAVAELQHNLTALGLFDDVHTNNITIEADGVENCIFDIQCTLKEVIGK